MLHFREVIAAGLACQFVCKFFNALPIIHSRTGNN